MDSSARKPYFIDDDDGLVSLLDVKAGGNGQFRLKINHAGSKNRSVSSPRVTARFYDARFEDNHRHFLDACFLCRKPLGSDKDIFMYRGDTPFCSEECRRRQIEMDEAKEKKRNLSSSIKAMRKNDQRKSTSPDKSTANHDCRFRSSTVAAA